MDEFVIEKYIEIIKGISINIMYKFMLIQILTLLVLLNNGMIRSTFIYLQQKDITKKVKLVAWARGYREHK